MELMAINVTTICICLSILLIFTPHCTAMQIIQKEQPAHGHQQAGNEKIKFSFPTLPRKLRALLHDQEVAVKSYAAQGSTSLNKQKGDSSSGKPSHKEEKVVPHGGRPAAGTWREWVEGTEDTSHFFTMDYTRVRRRRPIHNKSVPVVGP